jgi:aspartate 1-decarboxylase
MWSKEKMYAKIHRAVVTGANLNYEGSITIGKTLLTASTLKPFDRVQVLNITTGKRIETYVIEGEESEICLNGAAAHFFKEGDLVIIIGYMNVFYGQSSQQWKIGERGEWRQKNIEDDSPYPVIVIVDGTPSNAILEKYMIDEEGRKIPTP